MKKIVITIAAVVFAAVAVKAQSPGAEVRGMDACLGGHLCHSKVAFSSAKANQKNTRTNLQRKVTNKVQRATAADAQKKAKNTKAQPAKPAPKKAGAKAKPAQKSNVSQWIKAVFLGAPLPGESAEVYHDRLLAQSQPASQPFK